MAVKINTKLLPVKACYFFFFGGVAPVLPFLPVYARQLGLSEVGVGAVYLALPIMAALARPLVGGLADATRRHKLVFLLLLVVTTLGYAALSQVPRLPTAAGGRLSADVQLDCAGETFIKQCAGGSGVCQADRLQAALDQRNDTVVCELSCGGGWPDCGGRSWCDGAAPLLLPLDLSAADRQGLCMFLPVRNVSAGGSNRTVVRNPSCPRSNAAQCQLSCADAALMKQLNGKADDAVAYYRTGQFWLFLTFLVFAWVGTSLCVPLADSIAFKLLDDPSRYGYQRVWGSVGWGLFSFVAGYLVDTASAGRDHKDYSQAFYLLIGLMILNIMVCTRLDVSALKQVRPRFRSGLGSLLTRPRVLLFILSCCMVGIMTGVLWTFFFLYLQDLATTWDCNAYQWTSIISGATLLIQCFAGEVPFFFISGWAINKLGHVQTQTVVLLAFGTRFLLYSLIRNPWLVLPVELLNGLTFGLFYANMVAYAGIIAPPGMTATLQGLVGAAFENIGVAIGSGTGGVLYFTVGGARMFQMYGLVCLTSGALYVLAQCIVTRRCGDSESTAASHVSENMLQEMRPLSADGAGKREQPAPSDGVALTEGQAVV